MQVLRPRVRVILAAMLLMATTTMSYGSVGAQGGDNAGGPGCTQNARGAGAGRSAGAGLLEGGNRQGSGGVLVSVVGLLVQNANVLTDVADVVAAINALNSNNINAQVVCLNNVLNGNDIRILNNILNNPDVLNNSPILSNNDILNDALDNAFQNANIALLNNVQVVAVNLGGVPQIFVMRR